MYTPISCVVTGQQFGGERFPSPSSSPPLKSWRCNLTALAQSANLFFVACTSAIHVHEPRFPAQALGAPARVLEVPRSGDPHRVGNGIDPVDPHSVTRVAVEWFGDEEVLVCTCDDGDVVAWWVGEIHRAIVARRNNPGADESDRLFAIRPFDIHWMEASAWGLAVHRSARLIAISANTHEVRVLVYGLARPEEEGDLFPRKTNGFIRLKAKANIPSVAFDNTGADPAGRWLASSSIDGLTHLWDLTTPEQPARVIALSDCVNPTSHFSAISMSCNCWDRHSVPHAAWGAMFLDPRSFHCVDSLADACGPGVKPNNEVAFRVPCFWDITDRREPQYRRYSDETDTNAEIEAGTEASSSDEEDEDSDSLFIPLGSTTEDPNTHAASLSTSTQLSLSLPSPSLSEEEDSEEDYPYPDCLLSEPHGQAHRSKHLYCAFETAPFLQTHLENSTTTPSPLLIITRSEIYLVPSPLSPTPSTRPILTMRNPLYTSSGYPHSPTNHRQCFSAQIPELGVFIVASPSGRAGIFRLTRTRWDGEVVYGFRMEWMLLRGAVVRPLGGLETEAGGGWGDEVYTKALVGVGVGPVQGMEEGGGEEGRGKGRRWRVTMYYHDHTVVAYEVGKFGAEGVEDLVV